MRPLHGFGSPNAIRVSVGTPEEHALLAAALDRVLAPRLRALAVVGIELFVELELEPRGLLDDPFVEDRGGRRRSA